MAFVGFAVFAVGVIMVSAAGILLLIAAFRKSLLWGFAYLFVPLAAIVFVYQNWQETKPRFFLWLEGIGIMTAGLFVLFLSVPSTPKAASAEPQPTAEVPAKRLLGPAPVWRPTVPPVPTLAPPATAPPLTFTKSRAPLGPEAAGLRIYFKNPFREGQIILRADGAQVFNRVLQVRKYDAVVDIDESVEVRPGSAQMQLWVISTDRTTNEYRVLPMSFSAGEWHALELELQPAGLAVAVR